MFMAKGSGNLTARLHAIKPKKGGGEVYSVLCGGELLVSRSRNPECDAARALLAKGIMGMLTTLDGKTGKSRTTVHIERAASLTVKEGPYGPRFVRDETVLERAPMPKTEVAA
jgi:hypothetical protein